MSEDTKLRNKEAVRRYRQRYPERIKEQWDKHNKTRQHRESHRICREKLKLEVLTHYSPNGALGCCWTGCNIVDIDMLTLDHINDNGSEQRRLFGQDCNYRLAKRLRFPTDLQTLCMNHQLKKKLEKHRRDREESA
jgi:hypothetical protein